jgi:hypothetical protein
MNNNPKQDRSSIRSFDDLQRRYNFDKSFAEIMGIAQNAQKSYEELSGVTTEIREDLDNISLKVGKIDGLEKTVSEIKIEQDGIDLSVYAKTETLANYATADAIEGLATKEELGDYAKTDAINGLATKKEVEEAETRITAEIGKIDLSVYATTTDIEETYAKTEDVKASLSLKIEKIDEKNVSILSGNADKIAFQSGEITIESEDFNLNEDGVYIKDASGNSVVGMHSGNMDYPSLVNPGRVSPVRFYAGAFREGFIPVRTKEIILSTNTQDIQTMSFAPLKDGEDDLYIVDAKCIAASWKDFSEKSNTIKLLQILTSWTAEEDGSYTSSFEVQLVPSEEYEPVIIADSLTVQVYAIQTIHWTTVEPLKSNGADNGYVKVTINAAKAFDYEVQYIISGSYYSLDQYANLDVEKLNMDISHTDSCIDISLAATTLGDYRDYLLTIQYQVDVKNQKFKVLQDGSLYASAASISGTIYATDGEFNGTVRAINGEIGDFKINNQGLVSDSLKITPTQALFETGIFNLNNKVKIFDQGSVSYIITTGTGAFEIKNYGGAGIRFNPTEDKQEIRYTITLNNFKGTREYTGSENLHGYTFYNYKHYVTFDFTVGASNTDVLVSPEVINLQFKVKTQGLEKILDQTVTIPAGTHSGSIYTLYANEKSQYQPAYSSSGYDYIDCKLTESNTWGDPITTSVLSISTTNNVLYSLGSFCPYVPEGGDKQTTYTLGDDGHIWGGLRMNVTPQTDSDRRLKNTIVNIPNEYEQFFDALQPVSFKYNQNTSDRMHLGFIAQDVEESLNNAGIATKDFAGICIGTDEDKTYSLRYEEFIPLNTLEIQKLKARIKELENRLEKLEKG